MIIYYGYHLQGSDSRRLIVSASGTQDRGLPTWALICQRPQAKRRRSVPQTTSASIGFLIAIPGGGAAVATILLPFSPSPPRLEHAVTIRSATAIADVASACAYHRGSSATTVRSKVTAASAAAQVAAARVKAKWRSRRCATGNISSCSRNSGGGGSSSNRSGGSSISGHAEES